MVRFANETTIVGDGPSHCNDDFDDTESKHLNNSITVRKKRLPSTPHPASLDGIKKRSPSNDRGNDRNNVDEQANMCIASQDVDAPIILKQTDTMDNTKLNVSNGLVEYGSKGEVNVAKFFVECSDKQHEGKRILDSSDSNKHPEGKTNKVVLGVGISDENNDQNKRWNDFVDLVETKAVPNLDAYIKAKTVRSETSIRFANAIDACIQTLRDTTDGILSDAVEPICNRYSERFNDTEESITRMMVSNHSRRSKMLGLMRDADVAWNNKYNKLTAEIMGNKQPEQKCGMEGDTAEFSGKENGVDTDADGANREKGDDQYHSKGSVPKGVSKASDKEKISFGSKNSDWEELAAYEPSRDRILSFLDGRDKRNHTMTTFGDTLSDVHSGLENEVGGILRIASRLYNEHETLCLESEEEIEYFVMENYKRRGNLEKELEKSAQHAQGIFANLLSRLSKSAS